MLPAPSFPPIDAYILDSLLPDLVGHDQRPSAFLVYLALWRRSPADFASPVRISHQSLADVTGLSRSAVQASLAHLQKRSLISTRRATATAVPAHSVNRPWVRRGAKGSG